MTMIIKVTELLEFLTKAQELSFSVSFIKYRNCYGLNLWGDWADNGICYKEHILITNDGQSNTAWRDFYSIDAHLNELLLLKKEKEIKIQKRQELINRLKLTEEEKEILGIED